CPGCCIEPIRMNTFLLAAALLVGQQSNRITPGNFILGMAVATSVAEIGCGPVGSPVTSGAVFGHLNVLSLVVTTARPVPRVHDPALKNLPLSNRKPGGGVESDEAEVRSAMEHVSAVRQRFVRPDDPARRRLEARVDDMLRKIAQTHPERPISRFLRIGARP